MEAAHTKCKQSLFEGWLDIGRFYFHLCNFCIFKLATMNQKDFVNRTSKCFKSYFLKKRNSVKKMSCDLMDCSPSGSSVHGIPKYTRVGCHVLLQRIFPTQGSNLHLLHWQAGSLPLRHLGSKDKYKGYLKFVFPPRWNDYFSKEYFFIFLAQIIFVKRTIKQDSCLFFLCFIEEFHW